jgi:hypothetical protein
MDKDNHRKIKCLYHHIHLIILLVISITYVGPSDLEAFLPLEIVVYNISRSITGFPGLSSSKATGAENGSQFTLCLGMS